MDIKELEKFPEVIELNVGGVHYTTSLTTLIKGGDDMLSSMFSGRHNISKDKDGRYFIDADGSLFAYILRYLRTGDLPSDKFAPQIYQEAKYYGLQELAQLIERMPVMMAVQARLQFQDKLKGFEEAVAEILNVAACKQGIVSDEIISYAHISILQDNPAIHNPLYNPEHICWRQSSGGLVTADVFIGPWKNTEDLEITERIYFRALSREFESRGFTVTHSKVGSCSSHWQSHELEILTCPRILYKFVFHWHKFS